MKNMRTKLYVTALALVVGVSPVLGCTAVPKANTSRPTVAEAQGERKSTTPTVKPETKPAPKPETKPVVPESKPVVPETKPSVPAPQPVLPTPSVPETKPVAPKPSVPAPKPVLPTPSVPAPKPVPPAPTVKPETKPVVPEAKPCKPCKPEAKPCKPETKPCKPCKPEAKPAGKFTIDNFKIIQQSLERLGVSPSELEVMIKEGKKLIDVLNERDIPVNKFRKVLYKEYCLTIKNGVKNKQITKEEGKLLQAAIKQKVMSWMKDR